MSDCQSALATLARRRSEQEDRTDAPLNVPLLEVTDEFPIRDAGIVDQHRRFSELM